MTTLFALLIGLQSLAPAPAMQLASDELSPVIIIEGVDVDASRVAIASRLV